MVTKYVPADYANIDTALANYSSWKSATGYNYIIVTSGYISNERITRSVSGNGVGAELIIQANTGDTITMQGFSLNASNYLKIVGFDITHNLANQQGILISSATDVTIDDCYLYDVAGRGIQIWQSTNSYVINNVLRRCQGFVVWITASGTLIENNEIDDSRNYVGSSTADSGQADGFHLTLYGSGGNIYRRNYVHGITYANQVYVGEPPHSDGFQGYPNNDIFERNHIVMMEKSVHTLTSMHGFMLEGAASNCTIRNNLMEVTSFINTGSGYINNLYVYNNTVRSESNNWTGAYAGGIGGYGVQLDQVSGVAEIKNNIIVDYGKTEDGGVGGWVIVKTGSCTATVTEKNNSFWNSDGTTPRLSGITLDATSTPFWKVDPKFVTQWTNLQLQAISTLKDGGITIASVTNDYAGTARPQGSAYDIGAYEYGTGAPATPSGITIIYD